MGTKEGVLQAIIVKMRGAEEVFLLDEACVELDKVSQLQGNQQGGTLLVHLLALVVLGHEGVGRLGTRLSRYRAARATQVSLPVVGIVRSFLQQIFGVSPQAEEQDLEKPAPISNSCPWECLDNLQAKKQRVWSSSLGLEFVPAISKPNPISAWQARLLLQLILVWATLPSELQYPWDLPALITSRV